MSEQTAKSKLRANRRSRSIIMTPIPFAFGLEESEASEAFEGGPVVTLPPEPKAACWQKTDAPSFQDILAKIREVREALASEQTTLESNLQDLKAGSLSFDDVVEVDEAHTTEDVTLRGNDG